MSGKNQYPVVFNFQNTDPRTNFRPVPAVNGGGSAPSGVTTGTMSGTNTIYTQIVDVSRMDNATLMINFTGTPTGSLNVYHSVLGDVWPSLSIPGLVNPAGSAGYQAVNFNQFGFRYLVIGYTNSSGTGVLTLSMQFKDLN